MAINYPTSLDVFTNPTSTDPLTSPPHATQHANLNDAVEALEAYAGVTGSTVATSLTNQISLKAPIASPTFTGTPTLPTGTIATTQTAGNSTTAVATTAFVTTADQLMGTYTSYTPTLSGVTLGNGTLAGTYARVNDFIHASGSFTFGSTSAITGTVGIAAPVNINASMGLAAFPLGMCNLYDTSSGAMNVLEILWASATEFRIRALNTAAAYGVLVVVSATVPLTWATGDILSWNVYYRAA